MVDDKKTKKQSNLQVKGPVLNFIFKVPISGETKALYYDQTTSLVCDETVYER